MNPVAHFEIPAADLERAQEFYAKVFGWEIGEDLGGTRLVTTTPRGDNGMPNNPGEINGDIFKKEGALDKPIIMITVPSIDEHLNKIKAADGVTVVEKTQVGDMGWCAYFKDTEGNTLGIWESIK
jgi:predicted enzyme related to lactoylglutathione lyase